MLIEKSWTGKAQFHWCQFKKACIHIDSYVQKCKPWLHVSGKCLATNSKSRIMEKLNMYIFFKISREQNYLQIRNKYS